MSSPHSCACCKSEPSFSHSREDTSKRAAVCRLLETSHSLARAQRFFGQLRTVQPERNIRSLSRLQKRVDEFQRLINDAIKDLKLIGVNQKGPFIEFEGGVSLQDVSRRVKRIQTKLREKNVEDDTSDIVETLSDPPPDEEHGRLNPQGFWGIFIVAIAKAAVAVASGATNDTTDDEARKLINHALPEDLERMTDESLIKLLNDLLDGPTGDEDERAILKILRALRQCDRMASIVRRVGLDRLLSDVDGEEWDEMVLILQKCRIVDFRVMDDDASRLFVGRANCSQLGALNIDSVHQLVLNMFAGSCGDDDEDAILKLLGCQSTAKVQQLVSMPGTDVGAFDYNFDGDQWDILEVFFAAHGIELDP